jgi:hypothetical protein
MSIIILKMHCKICYNNGEGSDKMQKPETINFTLRMSVKQKLDLERMAYEQDRTVTNLINVILKKQIEEWENQKK